MALFKFFFQQYNTTYIIQISIHKFINAKCDNIYIFNIVLLNVDGYINKYEK